MTYPPLIQDAANTAFSTDTYGPTTQHDRPVAPPAEYISPPPPQPFSSEDATDAIALRAAISSLQFQKKKAQDDIRALEKIRKQALDDPEVFKNELAAGRLNERKPQIGDLRAILDQADSDSEDGDGEHARLGASADDEEVSNGAQETTKLVEIPDSQPSRPTTSSSTRPPQTNAHNPPPFDSIPGPQNVVRMPYINWEKYHISGDALDSMHEQQRRWPGNFAYGQDRGREHVVAAPYSPWLDSLDGQQRWDVESRKDSIATPVVTPTVSEHPMETRRGGRNQ